jgi:hypothetical protein
MRTKLALLVAATSLTLGASVATADTADARRNVGGTVPADTSCLEPGAVVLPAGADARVPCVCYITPAGDRFHNLGRGDCPAGIPEIKINRRNVGG